MIAQFFKAHKTVLVSLLIWLAAVLTFFSPAVFNNKVIAPIDCVECIFRPFAYKPIENVHNQFIVDGASQYLPHKWALQKSWDEDGYMGWNPYSFNGTACPENTMYSPGDWHNLLFAFLPFWTAWDLGIILQFFIAGCGMLLLLRHFKIPAWGALLAAISFAFYSQFIICLYYRWMGGIIWTPYLVWALLKYRHNLINVPAIIFMSLTWRGGHLQACTFAFFLVACVWFNEVWKKDNKWLSRKEFCKCTLSYFLTGALGALLSLDVFVDTLPRMEGCKKLIYSWGITNLLTLPTTLFPNIFGTPQTIDIARSFDLSLFDIKFGGGIVFILATIACFNPKAPRVAKVIFLANLIATCSPLYTYLYSRSTVVMALGMALLAAWQLCELTKVQFSPIYWKRIGYTLGILLIIWLGCSVIIVCFRDSLADLLNNIMKMHSTSLQRIGRADWYTLRVDRLLSQLPIWQWQNILFTAGLLLGVVCCCRIKPHGKHNICWVAAVILITFSDLLTFSYSWLSYSKVPESTHLYQEPSWLPELKSYVKDGSVRTIAQDADFLCNNHLSSYGIRLAGGYETVQPKHIHPLTANFDTKDYAKAGISHILSDTKRKTTHFPGWVLVMQEKQFELYANPDYKGRYLVNDTTPIAPEWRTSNRISLRIPPNSTNLSILESYHKGWKAYCGKQELSISPTKHGGMHIQLPTSSQEQNLLVEFYMPYREWYYTIMAITFLGLILVAIKQKISSVRN